MNIARVREHVRSVPQQLNASRLHAFFKLSNDYIEVLVGFFQSSAFRCNVYIVEAVVRSTQLFNEFEVNFYASLSKIKTGNSLPRTDHVALSEWIATVHS
ncbi:hypothetical protein D3C81_1565930 [compost metagenome]